MMTFGALISGPTNHYWYAVLERVTPGVSTRATVIKTALDQVVFAPFILSCFFGSISISAVFRSVCQPFVAAAVVVIVIRSKAERFKNVSQR